MKNMQNRIKINKLLLQQSAVTYSCHIEGDWKKYFRQDVPMCVEYSMDISGVPESVLVLPLLCNIMPIAWLCDAQICLEEVDADFCEHLGEIRAGYQTMYPMFKFYDGGGKGGEGSKEYTAPIAGWPRHRLFFQRGSGCLHHAVPAYGGEAAASHRVGSGYHICG